MTLTLADLRKILKEMSCPDRDVSIGADIGPDRDNVWCILPKKGKWVVFYSERGSRWDEQSFDTEHLACIHFLRNYAPRYFAEGPPQEPRT